MPRHPDRSCRLPSLSIAIIACLLLAGLGAGAAVARDRLSLSPSSSAYEVGLMFYKMIGKQPDVASWIMADPLYVRSPEQEQPELLKKEVEKLDGIHKNLVPGKSAIVIRASVRVKVRTKEKDTKQYLEVQYPTQGAIYFPYVVADQTISVIPNGIDLYRSIPLAPAEAQSVMSLIDYNELATMVVEVVPTRAEGRGPIKMDGIPQWMMIGEIGFIGFFNSYLEEIWSVSAPGYVRKGGEGIFNLHSGAGAGDTGLGAIKPSGPGAPPRANSVLNVPPVWQNQIGGQKTAP